MYIRVRDLSKPAGQQEIVLPMSKSWTISKLCTQIFEKLGIPEIKQRLYYKGKQLVDSHCVVDYGIQLNDVVQLMIRADATAFKEQSKENQDPNITEPSLEPALTTENKIEHVAGESNYYKVNDEVDFMDPDIGAWFEGIVVNIFLTDIPLEIDISVDNLEPSLVFKIQNVVSSAYFELSFNEIRPRSYHYYKFSDLTLGSVVLANYNLEHPNKRGYWYEYTITKITPKSLQGSLVSDKSKTLYVDRTVSLINEVLRIEKPQLLKERSEPPMEKIPLRRCAALCDACDDNPNKKCKQCGCSVCGGKFDADKIIICDECGDGYHIQCLNPPLTEVPDIPEWYCSDCKVDNNEIVKPGEKLKNSGKRGKAATATDPNKKQRDWGSGMQTMGRSKECTIVPPDHYGPIPGVEIGTRWMYRIQASEAGVHRAPVAGIHGRGEDGAYSLCLSGGYEDDYDEGEQFIYTGAGGRDLKGNKRVNKQSKDQTLETSNRALARNCDTTFSLKGGVAKNWKNGRPVRVIRRHHKESEFAPSAGYRYDGIYKVVKYYKEIGKAGFIVWKYVMRRDDPIPAPWHEGGQELDIIFPPNFDAAQAAKAEAKAKAQAVAKAKRLAKKKERGARKGQKNKRKRQSSPSCSSDTSEDEKKKSRRKPRSKRVTSSSSKSSSSSSSDTSEDEQNKSRKPRGKRVTSSSPKQSRGKKRSASVSDIPAIFKKAKILPFVLDANLKDLISKDVDNKKIWDECEPILNDGRAKYLGKLEELFMCICCQELVYKPITLECKHTVCKECLTRSFKSEIYNCPHCRFALSETLKMEVNEPLQSILLALFVGYNANR